MDVFESPEDRAYLVDFEDGVLRLTLNRPESGNAMISSMVPGLIDLFRNANGRARSVLIRGEGKTFSAGGDINAFSRALAQSVDERQEDFRVRIGRLRLLVEAVVGFEGPMVVAMRGAAVGVGLVFPLAADVVIGDPTALFAFGSREVGLSPDGGVSALLPRTVGERRARSLLLRAARVKAEEAHRLGLLDRVVEPEQLDEICEKEAARLARGPRLAMSIAKKLVNDGRERSLGDQLDAERDGVVACVGDRDFEEGVSAFLERRPADFAKARGEA